MTDSPKKKKTRKASTLSASESALSAPAQTAKKWHRTYLSLSFSAPPDLEKPMNDRAAAKGFRSRSEYLCALVEEDLRKAGLLKEPVGSKVKLSRVGAGSRGGQGGKVQGDGAKK
jgi:hypothetical protein